MAWIRTAEARGVLECLHKRRDIDVPATNGDIASLVRYFAPDSVQARKYRASALIVRRRKGGDHWLAWVREHEAVALITAAENRTDTEVRDPRGELTGLVHYFDAESEPAKSYRSTTRLLRLLASR